MVVKLSKEKILQAIKAKLDAMDEREIEVTGKPYFPTKLFKPSRNPKKPKTNVIETWFIFETVDGKGLVVRMSRWDKIPEGQEHS